MYDMKTEGKLSWKGKSIIESGEKETKGLY